MKLKKEKYYVIVEITDPYIKDLDYTGLDSSELENREEFARLLDKGYYKVKLAAVDSFTILSAIKAYFWEN